VVFDKKDSLLYIFGNDPDRGWFNRLYKLSLKNLLIEPVAAPLDTFERTIPKYLFYSEESNEYFAFMFNLEKAEIYSLFKYEEEKYLPSGGVNSAISYYFVTGVLLFAVVLIGFLRKRKGGTDNVINKRRNEVKPKAVDLSLLHNKIYLFGEFKLLAGEEDLSDELTPKLRQVFLLILFYTFNGNGRRGISSEKLNNYIWPDSSQEEVKNLRGVTIRNLRKVLEKADGIKVVTEGGYWKVLMEEGVWCDYIEFKHEINLNKDLRDGEKLIKILERGELLQGEDYEWLEPIKIKVDKESINSLLLIVKDENLSEEKREKGVDAILAIDSLSEIGIIWKVRLNLRKGERGVAKLEYERLTQGYKKYFGFDFPESFDSIVLKEKN
jgi:DNA-binding SARP family transcriptional activator